MTGTVTVLMALRKTSSPVKVPAINPKPGRALATTPTTTVDGAVPLDLDTVSQLPLSDVFVDRVQFKSPAPPFRIWRVFVGGLPVAVTKEKLTWPGTLSKKAPVDATVRETGMVMAWAPVLAVNTICPV